MNTGQRFLRLTAVWLTVALAGSSAIAQTGTGGPSSPGVKSLPSTPSNFGPGESVLSIGAVSFAPLDPLETFAYSDGAKYLVSGAKRAVLAAGINLPTGAVLDVFEFEVYGNDAINPIIIYALVCSGTPAGTPCTFLGSTDTNGTGTPGWEYVAVFPSPTPTTIDNGNNQYLVEVSLPLDSANMRFRRVEIFYHLQVSPAPLTATFTDVPTSDFGFQFVEAFAAAGITVGCNASPPMFCPDRNVTRREMAVFFAKALGLYFPF